MKLIDKIISRQGVREFWFLNRDLKFGPETSSNPKDHCSIVGLFRIPIKSNATHVIDAAHVAKLEAALKVAVEALKNSHGVVNKINASKALAEIERIAGGE